jgi:hypothetical protein
VHCNGRYHGVTEATTWPWDKYGGSFIWSGGDGRASLPGRCCKQMQPVRDGECRDGCCEDYHCAACGKVWRYEFPD